MQGAARLVGSMAATLGIGRRWDLGSGVGQCSSILGLLLSVPTWKPAALGLSCHHTGLTLVADSKPGCCLEKLFLPYPQPHYRWEPIHPAALRASNSGTLSLQPVSVYLTPCSSSQVWMQRPDDSGRLPFQRVPGLLNKGGRDESAWKD